MSMVEAQKKTSSLQREVANALATVARVERVRQEVRTPEGFTARRASHSRSTAKFYSLEFAMCIMVLSYATIVPVNMFERACALFFMIIGFARSTRCDG